MKRNEFQRLPTHLLRVSAKLLRLLWKEKRKGEKIARFERSR